jgi:hypothetical protein
LTDETIKKLKKIFEVKWTIYIALVFSIFIYFIFSIILKKLNVKFIDDTKTIILLSNIFGGVTAVLLFISFYIRKNLSEPEKFIKMLKERNLNPKVIRKYIEHLDNEAVQIVGDALLLSNTIDIVSWMLCEAIALFGLVLFFLSGNIMYVQAFGGIALLAMAFFRPNFSNFINIFNAALKEAKQRENP